MTYPRIAIIGRPNVGKSSLLNRLSGERVAIVDELAGVTRDRLSHVVEIKSPSIDGQAPLYVELFDTGGYGVYTSEGARYDDIGKDLSVLTEDIEKQIIYGIEHSSLILFVIDAQSGLTPLDEKIASLLRKWDIKHKIQIVANKVDGQSWESHGVESSKLGFGNPICVSATSGYNTRSLFNQIWKLLKHEKHEIKIKPSWKMAIVGKRNAGKSSLVNSLVGEDRMIVSEIAGTTRDSVDVHFQFKNESFTVIDTAGVRKKKSFNGDLEYYAHHRMLKALDRCNVALLLIDATKKISHVDQKLSQELLRRNTPTIIGINKWDLVEDKIKAEEYVDYLTEELRGLEFAPIVILSAKKSEGLQELIGMSKNLFLQSVHREPTNKINKLIQEILNKRGPSSRLGTQAKLYYASQTGTQPPSIMIVVNKPELFQGNYSRYLMNQLREALPYSEIPINIEFVKRKRKGLSELKHQGWRKEKEITEDTI